MECKALSCYIKIHWRNDYCSYHERCLSKLKEYYNINFVKEVETFTTWFNGNCGYVINCDEVYSREYPYLVWVVIYEPAVGNMGENLSAIKYGNWSSLPYATDKARELKRKLQNNGFSDTPMLEVHPKANSYEYFSSLITSPYVIISRNLPSREKGGCLITGDYLSNPRNYLKPLDIVKVDEGDYEHVGVYLGGNEVCHFSKKYKGTRVHRWGTEDGEFLEEGIGQLTRYHPIIPFKHYSKIVRQIAASVSDDFRANDYNLRHRNCEHFANMIVYGINYSEQVESKKGLLNGTSNFARGFFAPFTLGASIWATDEPTVNNDKGSTIKLTNEMSESNGKLDYSSSDHWRAREIGYRYLQEVPRKDNCRIM